MRFELYLFDADDTLFDFKQAEQRSIERALAELGVVSFTERWFARYREINSGLWRKLALGEISKSELAIQRFSQLMGEMGCDSDPGKCSELYLEKLGECAFMVDEAQELLQDLKESGAQIGIVTNGIERVQKSRLSRSPIAGMIDFMVVSEECGYAKPHPRILEVAIDKAERIRGQSVGKDRVLLIGDRLETDIQGGYAYGVSTCWFNPNAEANDLGLKPSYEIRKLSELRAHLPG